MAPRFNYHRADWEAFRHIIDSGLANKNSINTTNDIEFETVYLANLIQSARNKSVPLFKNTNCYKNWLCKKNMNKV